MSTSARTPIGIAVDVLALIVLRRRRHPNPHVRPLGVAPATLTPSHPPISHRGWIKLLVTAALLIVVAAASYAYHKTRLALEQRTAAIALVGGNPDNGSALMVRYGCAGCHALSALPQAVGQVGPPLDNVARRPFVGGILTTTPDNMIGWIVDPRAYDPQSAMPRTGISGKEARDLVTYLYGVPG